MLNEFGDVPGEGATWLKAMRALSGYALDIEEVPADPTAGVKFLKARHEEGFRSWTEDEIVAFQAHYPFGTLP